MSTHSRAVICLGASIALVSCAGALLGYSSGPVEGWIKDAETGEPISGANIVAYWDLREAAIPAESYSVGPLMLQEDVSDEKGRFYFKAWGPVRVAHGRLADEEPKVIIYKSGYEPWISDEYWSRKRPNISLKPFRGTLEREERIMTSLYTDLEFSRENCHWKEIPSMITTLDLETKRLRSKGAQMSLYSIDGIPKGHKHCPAPADVFRSLPRDH